MSLDHVNFLFFFSSRRRHTRYIGDWSSDVCSSDLATVQLAAQITVVKPLDPIPPRRLEYHAPQLLSCPATQYPHALKRRAIGGHVVLDLVVDTLGRVPRDRIVVREGPPPGLAQAAT